MRLLNTRTLELESVGDAPGKYAVLSHTWGSEELLFDDVCDADKLREARWKQTKGFRKVSTACEIALKQGLTYLWVDTCCIDKRSSAELSEALNSMFAWYRDAAVCFAFLADVALHPDGVAEGFESSRWFSRGWTLQELLAPDDVEFFTRDWVLLGTRGSLSARVSRITGIGENLLRGRSRNVAGLLRQENVATRMGWAAHRETRRVEDMAYCLMGIFGVNMPILYGEGGRAFLRLQEEILKTSQDQSMLIWRTSAATLDGSSSSLSLSQQPQSERRSHFLADSPRHFNLRTFGGQENPARFGMRMTGLGLELRVWKCPCRVSYAPAAPPFALNGRSDRGQAEESRKWLAVLDCSLSSDTLARAAILLEASASGDVAFRRLHSNVIMIIEPKRSGFLMVGGDVTSHGNSEFELVTEETGGGNYQRIKSG